MARSGITKKQVKKAVNSLHAQGESITVDAVRIALGNTGSKTTICRYLNELDKDKEARLDKMSYLSDEITVCVGDLAKRLQEEANAIVTEAQERHNQAQQNLHERFEQLRQELIASQQQIEEQQSQLSHLKHQLEDRDEQLREADKKLAVSVEQHNAFKAQLEQKDKHNASIEEQFKHSRDSLAHYRESVKTQREQDQNRHQSQIQQLEVELRKANQLLSVKQNEITSQSKCLARLEQSNTFLESTVDKQSEQLSQIDTVYQSLQIERSEMAMTIEKLHAEMASLEDRFDAEHKENTLLNANYAKLQQRKTKLEAELETKNQIFDQWMTKIQTSAHLSERKI